MIYRGKKSLDHSTFLEKKSFIQNGDLAGWGLQPV